MFDLQILKQLPRETVWENVASPIGPLTVLASDNGVHAIAFGSDQTEQAKINFPRAADHPIINAAVEQLAMYFEGTLKIFDLPLVHRGKRSCAYQFDLRLSLRHGLSRNPEGFKSSVCMSDGNLYAERLTPRCTRLARNGFSEASMEIIAGNTLWRDANLWRHRLHIGQCGRITSRGCGQW